MRLFPRFMFALMRFLAAHRGLRAGSSENSKQEGQERGRIGVLGENLAYWYLRRQGYTVVARNYRSAPQHGEIDLIGWDGPVLAFVEVKTRTTTSGGTPEEAVNAEKRRNLVGMARSYLARHKLSEVPFRFDVVALETRWHSSPAIRLHKRAFTPSV